MSYSPTTKSGHSLWTIRSLLQKAIRRGDLDHAGYAANELYLKYNDYMWKTLLTISAEDCYGVMTKEILALREADKIVNNDKSKRIDKIFVAKALVLLCMARKNRDACYVACNFMLMNREMDVGDIPGPEDLEFYMREYQTFKPIPAYTYDKHTVEGRRAGKTTVDMLRDEEAALTPHQYSLFDNASWKLMFDDYRRTGDLDDKVEKQLKQFQKGKESDPTHQGEYWPPDHMEG